MPQLNPNPWFFIVLLSWPAFSLIIQPKLLLVSTPNNHWITNHLSTLQLWLFHLITKK